MARPLPKLTFEILQSELRQSGYTVDLHDDPSTEASVRATRGGERIHVSLFSTGTIRINGPQFWEHRRDIILERLQQLVVRLEQTLGRDAYEFLDGQDKEFVLASRALCESTLELVEYSGVVMPLAKAFEGFSKKVLVRLNIGNPAEVDAPTFFREAFGSAAYTALRQTNREDWQALERVRTHLPFSRHGLMHSPARPEFVFHGPDTARAKEAEIHTIMRETYERFRGRI